MEALWCRLCLTQSAGLFLRAHSRVKVTCFAGRFANLDSYQHFARVYLFPQRSVSGEVFRRGEGGSGVCRLFNSGGPLSRVPRQLPLTASLGEQLAGEAQSTPKERPRPLFLINKTAVIPDAAKRRSGTLPGLSAYAT